MKAIAILRVAMVIAFAAAALSSGLWIEQAVRHLYVIAKGA